MLTIAEYMDGRRTERKDVRLPCERDQVAATLEPSRPIIDCLPSRLEAPFGASALPVIWLARPAQS